MSWFNIRLSLGGLWIFIYGMFLFEHSISELSTGAFKRLIQKWTSTKLWSIVIGTLWTIAVQNSWIISLLAMWFAGAGIISLLGAVWLVVGANIGTTFQWVMIALLGFKYDIQAFSLPFIAIGWFVSVVSTNEKLTTIAKCMLGFGFLFLGLDFMKDNMEAIGNYFHLQQYVSYGPVFYFLLWVVLTVIIQTSSWLTALTLAAINSGIITFPLGVAVVIGANLWTTSTALFASLGGKAIKRQVARSHMFFNLLFVMIGAIFFWPSIILIEDIWWYKSDPVTWLAVYNVLFNVATTIAFYPVMGSFVTWMKRLIPEKKNDFSLETSHINVESDIPEIVLSALRTDLIKLCKKTFRHNMHILHVDNQAVIDSGVSVDDIMQSTYGISDTYVKEDYLKINAIADELADFIIQYTTICEDETTLIKLQAYSHCISDILYAAKSVKDCKANIQQLLDSDQQVFLDQYVDIKDVMIRMYRVFVKAINGLLMDEEDKKELIHLLYTLQHVDTKVFLHRGQNIVYGEIDMALIFKIRYVLALSTKSFASALVTITLPDDLQETWHNQLWV